MTDEQNDGKLPSLNTADTSRAIARAEDNQTALSKHLQAIRQARKNNRNKVL
jgi:hypothetical protein